MKRIFVVLAVLVAVALIGAGIAMAGISNTKHNLSSAATSNTYRATDTTEICVFCHTPHNASGSKPLWNKTVNSSGFNTYGTTLGGTTAGAVTTSTLLCFSCHDGVTALNSLSNFPGSSTSITMVNGVNTINGSYAALNKDLTNDHPVGIVYNEGRASLNTINNIVTNQAIIKVLASNSIQGQNASSTVECSSCHDPHSDANTSFLRVTNGSSTLCLACHNK